MIILMRTNNLTPYSFKFILNSFGILTIPISFDFIDEKTEILLNDIDADLFLVINV